MKAFNKPLMPIVVQGEEIDSKEKGSSITVGRTKDGRVWIAWSSVFRADEIAIQANEAVRLRDWLNKCLEESTP